MRGETGIWLAMALLLLHFKRWQVSLQKSAESKAWLRRACLNVPSHCQALACASPMLGDCFDAQPLASFCNPFSVGFSSSSCLSPGYRKLLVYILQPPGLASCSGVPGLTWSFT